MILFAFSWKKRPRRNPGPLFIFNDLSLWSLLTLCLLYSHGPFSDVGSFSNYGPLVTADSFLNPVPNARHDYAALLSLVHFPKSGSFTPDGSYRGQ